MVFGGGGGVDDDECSVDGGDNFLALWIKFISLGFSWSGLN